MIGDKKTLRNFGRQMGLVFKPLLVVWAKTAFIISWIITRIILTLFFYLVFTPIGLIMRLRGIDPLEKRIEKQRVSYWKAKEDTPFNPSDYERQF